jgi:hypothetical protein
VLLMADDGTITQDPVARIGFQQTAGAPKLDDLWLFTGSVCNLRCLHCYTGSSPENRTLEPLSRAETAGVLADAQSIGLGQVYLTGGEPFLHPEIGGVLEDCLAVAPTTVLTNATEPLAKQLETLRALYAAHGDRLQLRVSLDSYEPARHNAIRRDGAGRPRNAFDATAANVVSLAAIGYRPIITLSAEVYRGNPVAPAIVERKTQALFRKRGVEVEVKILPATLDQGTQQTRRDRAPIVPRATGAYLRMTNTKPADLMCHNSRLVAKHGESLVVYPCPVLVPDGAPAVEAMRHFALGTSLAASVERPVDLDHPSCATYCCNAKGVCGNG